MIILTFKKNVFSLQILLKFIFENAVSDFLVFSSVWSKTFLSMKFGGRNVKQIPNPLVVPLNTSKAIISVHILQYQ